MRTAQETDQSREWASDFGRDYTARNTFSTAELDHLWMTKYGVTRTAMNRKILGAVPQDARILEVGCNVGNQLLLLYGMGYTSLSGIDVQDYAVQIAQTRVPGISVIEGSALNIPFPDRHFDLVFTSGLLIHISPAELPGVLNEIHRVAKKWVMGSEYYAPISTKVSYRGHEDLLWKDDFAKLYQNQFADLQLLQEERLRYLNSPNCDTMFLLERAA